MPRGVYPRKKKGEAKSAPATKTAPSKKAAAPAKQEKKVTAKADASIPASTQAEPSLDIQIGFNILGANLTTLTEAFSRLNDNEALQSKVSREIGATVDAISELRQRVFGGLVETAPSKVEEAPAEEQELEEEQEAAAPTMPTLPQPPSLPQPGSNATGFHPPAPPIQG